MGLTFYKSLNYLSRAEDIFDLYEKVLEDSSLPLDDKNIVLTEVSKKLQKFITDNHKQIALFHLPALEKLQRLIQIKEDLVHDKDEALKEVVAKAIGLTQKSDFSALPANIFSLCEEFSTMNACINFALAGINPIFPGKTHLEKSINACDLVQMQEFLTELDERFKLEGDSHIAIQKIKIFFQFASFEKQGHFFKSISGRDRLLNHIISALPTKITSLNLKGIDITDENFDQIINFLTKSNKLLKLKVSHDFFCVRLFYALMECSSLQSLDLYRVNFKTEDFIQILANSPKMKRLETLRVPNLSETAMIAIINSPYLNYLSTVDFDLSKSTSPKILQQFKKKLRQNKIRKLFEATNPQVTVHT